MIPTRNTELDPPRGGLSPGVDGRFACTMDQAVAEQWAKRNAMSSLSQELRRFSVEHPTKGLVSRVDRLPWPSTVGRGKRCFWVVEPYARASLIVDVPEGSEERWSAHVEEVEKSHTLFRVPLDGDRLYRISLIHPDGTTHPDDREEEVGYIRVTDAGTTLEWYGYPDYERTWKLAAGSILRFDPVKPRRVKGRLTRVVQRLEVTGSAETSSPSDGAPALKPSGLGRDDVRYAQGVGAEATLTVESAGAATPASSAAPEPAARTAAERHGTAAPVTMSEVGRPPLIVRDETTPQQVPARRLTVGAVDLLVRCGLELGFTDPGLRRILLGSLPPGFVQSLPLLSGPVHQLRSDLMQLNATPRLIGLSHPPIAQWLRQAAFLAAEKHSTKGRVFSKQLDTLGVHRFGGDYLRIAYFAADPSRHGQLRLEEEAQGIHKAILLSQSRRSIILHPLHGTKLEDVQPTLLEHKPDIVHFSGHGEPDELQLMDTHLSEALLARLVRTPPFDSIKAVVLGACHSKASAEALADDVDVVIGMSGLVPTLAASSFAAGLYQALGMGLSVGQAIEQGRTAIAARYQDRPHLAETPYIPDRCLLNLDWTPLPRMGNAGM